MSEVNITVQETLDNVEIVAQNNVIEVNITRQSGNGGGAVDSVNGKTGAVVLDADDISETATRFWLTSVLKTAYDGAVAWISTNGANILNHISSTSNPHNVTKTQVGLGNVDNTSDLNKPISTATQTALNTKVDKTNWVDISLTSTIVGWSSFTQRTIVYKIIDDNLLYVKGRISGVSNSALANITIPFTSSSAGVNVGVTTIVNNGVSQAALGLAGNQPNSNVINLFRDNFPAAFTPSGTKTVEFSILIQL